MYRVTWVTGSKVKTITHPDFLTVWDIYTALNNNGELVRLWNKDGSLYR